VLQPGICPFRRSIPIAIRLPGAASSRLQPPPPSTKVSAASSALPSTIRSVTCRLHRLLNAFAGDAFLMAVLRCRQDGENRTVRAVLNGSVQGLVILWKVESDDILFF